MAEGARQPMSSAKILIIEDDLQIRTMLERFLGAQGFRVVAAGDGIEGIRVFSAERPDLVLLDMLLPKLLGTDVCDMMKRSVEGASVPVVMMSAVMKADNFQKDFRGKRRPDAFLVKPFQFSEMGRVVSALLAGRQAEDEPAEEGLEVLEIIDRGGSAVYALNDSGLFDSSRPYSPFAETGDSSASRAAPPLRPTPPPQPAAQSPHRSPLPPPPPPIPVGPPRPATAAAFRGAGPTRPPSGSVVSVRPASPPVANASIPAAIPVAPSFDAPPAPAMRSAFPVQPSLDAAPPSAFASPPAAVQAAASPQSPIAATARAETSASPRVVAREVAAAAPLTGGADSLEFEDLLEDVRRTLDDVPVSIPTVSPLAPSPLAPPPRPREVPAAPPASGAAILTFPSSAPSLPGSPVSAEDRGVGRITPKTPGPGLRETTFPELLFLLFRRIFSGVLRLEREGSRKEIYFLNGYPVHVESNLRNESLGRQLVKMQRISEESYLQVLQVMEEQRKSAAEVLVEQGLVSAQELSPILRSLERENLLRAFSWDAATYELERGTEKVARVPIVEMNPVTAVAEGLFEHASPSRLEAELAPRAGHGVRATADFSKHWPQVAPLLPELAWESLCDGSRRLSEVIRAGEGDTAGMVLSVKILLTLQMIELVEPARGVAPPSVPAPPAVSASAAWAPAVAHASLDEPLTSQPQAASAMVRELEERVLQTYMQSKRQNHFELLGVAMGAHEDELDRAYAHRAQAFHPDNLQYVASSEVRTKAKEIYLALGDAYEVLKDPARRAAYLDTLGQNPTPAPEQGTAIAEQEFRKGERFVQFGNWANAQVAFMNALKLNPREPEYYLFLGWSMYQNYRSAGNEAAINRAVGFIRKVIVMNPQEDRAFFFLGSIYRDRGQADLARQLYLRALKHNPNNADAQTALESLSR